MSLLQSMTQMVTPDLVAQIGNQFGMEKDAVGKATGIAMPLLLQGMQKKGGSTDGLTALMGMLGEADNSAVSNPMGAMMGALSGGGSPLSSTLLTGLFGDQLGTISHSLAKRTGIPALETILPMLAPLAIGYISKKSRDDSMDGSGLLGMLNGEMDSFFGEEAGESAGFLKQVWEDVDTQNRLRGLFDEAEWGALAQAPRLAGTYILTAAQTDEDGANKKKKALISALRSAATASDNPLFDAVVVDSKASIYEAQSGSGKLGTGLEAFSGTTFSELSHYVLTNLQNVNNTLDRVPAEEADGYKKMILSVVKEVAEADKEAGFLGFGGKRITEQENKILGYISDALGM